MSCGEDVLDTMYSVEGVWDTIYSVEGARNKIYNVKVFGKQCIL